MYMMFCLDTYNNVGASLNINDDRTICPPMCTHANVVTLVRPCMQMIQHVYHEHIHCKIQHLFYYSKKSTYQAQKI